MAKILTDEQVRTFKSMSLYWKEVRKRDDQSPLFHEAQNAICILNGADTILRLVEYYLEHEETGSEQRRTHDHA